jgi:hypothetical protein
MRFSAILAVCLSAAALSACHDDEVCNPGLVLKDGVCVPIAASADMDAGSPADAAGEGAGAPADASTDVPASSDAATEM